MPDPALTRPSEYRRRPFQAPHRRRRLWLRLLRPLAGAVLLVGLPSAVAAWAMTSPRFELRRIEIAGAERVDPGWARERLRPLEGRHLLTLRLADVQAPLARHPWIRDVGIRKLPPDGLEVELAERLPAAVIERDGARLFVERDGRPIAPYDAALHDDEPLVLVRGAVHQAALAEAVAVAERWHRVRPRWAGRLLELDAVGDHSYAARVEDLPFELLVRPANMELSLARFTRFLPEVVRRYPRLNRVDLRFDTQIVIHPAEDPRGREG